VTARTVMSVVGARPQFVKAAPVSRALARTGQIREVLVHTGQHHDAAMSDAFFDELSMPPPAFNLGVHGGGHASMTARMLEALEAVMSKTAPEMVLVYGDTNSTLAAALAAAKLAIPLAHVEAGLRSFDAAMPEEVNRIVADRLSSLLFCPTRASVANLRAEGRSAGVLHVGDVMYDATLLLARAARDRSDILERLGLHGAPYAVATLHRAATTETPDALRAALAYLRSYRERTGERIVLPLHPRTRACVEQWGLDLDGLQPAPPLGPLDMHRLLMGCTVVLTDSGGLQKEAYFHGKPCVTLRPSTEWVETVEAGWNRLWTVADYKPRREIDDYGRGDASVTIAAAIVEAFGRAETGGRAVAA
jgi:UDP-GlcNAc3NAcA epimerase